MAILLAKADNPFLPVRHINMTAMITNSFFHCRWLQPTDYGSDNWLALAKLPVDLGQRCLGILKAILLQ